MSEGVKSTKKKKPVRVIKGQECNYCGDTQHKVEKVVEEHKKVKPKEVFGKDYKTKGKSKK
jgi:hypothetical protein